jgi:enterochelin esterase family protein
MPEFSSRKSTPFTKTSSVSSAILCAILALAAAFAIAQAPAAPAPQPGAFIPPPPTPNDTLKSPEVQPDGTIQFRIYAPAAKEVRLQAEGPESTPGITSQEAAKGSAGYPMTRADSGVWSVAFGPIQPGVYRYLFLIDGVRVADPKNPLVSESLNSVWSMYEVPGAPFLEYRADTPHGAIASVWYNSTAIGGLRRMHIYTPPGYESGSTKYPVLYLLHGGGDSDDSWGTVGRAGAILDNLIAAHQAQPMIIVMPAGHISHTMDMRAAMATMGHDSFNLDLTGTIVPYIDQHYRTVADRDHRALAGLSMGGLQTLDIGLTNSDLFAWIGVFSSGWFPLMLATEEQTDLAQYKASGKPFKLYWVGVGKLDIANTNSKASVELLKKYGVTPITHESEGFHAWNNWRDYLHIFAPMLFR